MTRGNREARTRLVQAQEAMACLERALQLVDVLELSSLIGIRIQHAIDTMAAELKLLAGGDGLTH